MDWIGWEQTVYKKPAVESYQTANMDVDSEKDSEVDTSSENDLLFKRVVTSHCSKKHFILILSSTFELHLIGSLLAK